LPSFRALLVVDAEGFSRNRDADLPGMHLEIRTSVERACERSGLAETWKNVPVLQSTGDGVLAVLPAEAMIPLIHPFADHLQEVLADAAPRLRAHGLALRLRVALHAGLVEDADPVTAGISTATNEVCRLLDCESLRAALRVSDPDVTFAALIVSSEAFEMFVRGGRTGLPPSRFTRVRARVKQYDRPAFLYVPTPSLRDHAGDDDPPEPPVSHGSVTVNGAGSQNVIGSTVHGGVRQERLR
jgi:hypothetical protein